MVFEEFYDYRLFSDDYMYRRNWIGCTYQQMRYGARFEHYIESHGKLYNIVVDVKENDGGREISNFSVREVTRKKSCRKNDTHSGSRRGFIIAEFDVKDLTIFELYQLIIESSITNYIANLKVEQLLRGPIVSYNEFTDYINYHLEQMKG